MLKKSKVSFKDMPNTSSRIARTELSVSELKMVTGGADPNSSTFCNDVDYPN